MLSSTTGNASSSLRGREGGGGAAGCGGGLGRRCGLAGGGAAPPAPPGVTALGLEGRLLFDRSGRGGGLELRHDLQVPADEQLQAHVAEGAAALVLVGGRRKGAGGSGLSPGEPRLRWAGAGEGRVRA
jgi:hypothetical protein